MQNTSSAVMQRRYEPADSLDYFPTPPWATRALCEWILQNDPEGMNRVLEPACGEGHMARPLGEYFKTVEAFDSEDYGAGYPVRDFLSGSCEVSIRENTPPCDWCITNPPFSLAYEFIVQGLRCAERGVAMLVRTAFLEGQQRYRDLFCYDPPSDILQFTERVPMHKGKLTATGSTATAYCWVVWRKPETTTTRFHWIAPCRRRLERKSDYTDHP